MKRVAVSLLGVLFFWSACRAQGISAHPVAVSDAPPTEPTAVNWQSLYEKAESSAQQWEARDKEFEKEIAAQMREMDSRTLESTKKEKTEQVPPAPNPPAAHAHAAAATDYQSLFSNADSRGKAWRARAVVLEERFNRYQERLSAQKIRVAGTPTFAPRVVSGKVAIAARPVHVSGYPRSNGPHAAPYPHNVPPYSGR